MKQKQTSLKRSSETTRVTPFLLDFLHYIAGFIDGDGSIYVPIKGAIEIDITVGLEDLQTLYFLKKTLGFGLVKKKPRLNLFCIRILKKQWALLLLYSIKDKLCTLEKLEKIKVALTKLDPKKEWFINHSFGAFSSSPPVLSKVSRETAWFAGFCESQGCFTIQNKTTLCFSIAQKNLFILKECEKVFGGFVSFYKDNSGVGYCWFLTKLKEIENILLYFNRFPLKTKNRIKAFKFKRLVFFIKRGDHFSGPFQEKFARYVEKF